MQYRKIGGGPRVLDLIFALPVSGTLPWRVIEALLLEPGVGRAIIHIAMLDAILDSMNSIIFDRINIGNFPPEVLEYPSRDFDLCTFLRDEARGVFASCHKLNAWLDQVFEDGPLNERSLEELETLHRELTYNNGDVDDCYCTWSDGAKKVVTAAAAARATSGTIPSYVNNCIDQCLALRNEGLGLYKKTLAMVLDSIKEATIREEQKELQEELAREELLRQRQAARIDRMNQEREKHIQHQRDLLNWNHSTPSLQHHSHSRHGEGYIYILKNQAMPGIFKIGFTTKEPEKRAYEITSEMKMPVPFEVAYSWKTTMPFAVEQAIFSELEALCQGREFYTGELDYLAVVCESKLVR